jgi:hypothetical protein
MKLAPPHVWPSIQIAAYHTGAMRHRTMGTPFVLRPSVWGCRRGRPPWRIFSRGPQPFQASSPQRGVGESLPLRKVLQKPVLAEIMARFGMSREEAIEDLILNGGI